MEKIFMLIFLGIIVVWVIALSFFGIESPEAEKIFIFIFLVIIVVWVIAHVIYDIRRAWNEWQKDKNS